MTAPPSLGFALIDWIETFLCEGPGDSVGEPATVDDEYAAFVVRAYELRPKRNPRPGRKRYRRAGLSRPKGRGKSSIAAKLAVAEALGPVRFDHWAEAGEESWWGYVYEAGEPVGRPVTSPEVLCLATEEGQAGNTFDAVVVMTKYLAEHYGAHFPGLDPGITRVLLEHGSIEPVTARAKSKDGGNSTFCVFDETHLWDSRELHELAGTVRRNLSKRKAAEPWSLETTTAYRPGDDSEAERLYSLVERGGPATVLLDHRQVPDDVEWKDDDALAAALLELYGPAADPDTGWIDVEQLVEDIRDEQAEEVDSRRYFGNQIRATADTWCEPKTWARHAAADKIVADGELITLGFDGSHSEDATALVGCRVSDGHLFVLGVWQRPDGPQGREWLVPRDAVDDAVRDAFERFDVWRLYADPPYWQSEIAAWQRAFDRKGPKGRRVVEWWTNRDPQMAAALRNLRTALDALEPASVVSHDGDARLAEHVANCRRWVKRVRLEDGEAGELVLVKKDARRSPRKIDAAVTATLAFEARRDAVAAGAKPRRRRARAYSF